MIDHDDVRPIPRSNLVKRTSGEYETMAPAAAIEPPAEIADRPPLGGPAGPQLWAAALVLAGLYYLWTRVLGRSMPGGGGGGGVAASAAMPAVDGPK